MGYLLLKAAFTGILVVAISEIAKRSSFLAAILASLPLTSLLAFIWIYVDTKNSDSIRDLSYGVFWMVLPSLAFFLVLPALLKFGMRFYPSLALACICTAAFYAVYIKAISSFGIRI